MIIRKAFLELVRCAVREEPPRKEYFVSLEEKDWQQLFRLVWEQAEVACCYPVLLQLPKELRPSGDLLLQWFALKEKVVRRNRHRLKVWHEIYSRLKKAGYQAVVMKGWAFARYYPEPMERMSGDIDLFIPGQYASLLEAVHRAGYETERVSHHDSFEYDGVHVELHASLINPPVASVELCPEEICLEGNTVVPVPGLEANLLVMLTHIARHLMGYGFSFRHITDFLLLWKEEGAHIDREQLKFQLEHIGIDVLFDTLMRIGSRYMGMEDVFFCHPEDRMSDRLCRLLLDDIFDNGDCGQLLMHRRSEVEKQQEGIKKNLSWIRYYGHLLIRLFHLRLFWPQYAWQAMLKRVGTRLGFLMQGHPFHD